MSEIQKDRKTERQKDGKTERQKDIKTERQKDRKTERHKLCIFCWTYLTKRLGYGQFFCHSGINSNASTG
jgi:hypothetical protein